MGQWLPLNLIDQVQRALLTLLAYSADVFPKDTQDGELDASKQKNRRHDRGVPWEADTNELKRDDHNDVEERERGGRKTEVRRESKRSVGERCNRVDGEEE